MKRSVLPPMPPPKFPTAGSKKQPEAIKLNAKGFPVDKKQVIRAARASLADTAPTKASKPIDLKTPPEIAAGAPTSRDRTGTVTSRVVPSIDELERGLRWESKNLAVAQEAQADLFYQVAKQVAIVNSDRDSAKLYLEQAEAKVATSLREGAELERVKMTVDEVNQRVALDDEVQRIKKLVLKYTAESAQLSALREAYIQRGYAIRDHIMLQTQSGSAVDPANRLAEENRREMAQQRQNYRMPTRTERA